MEVKMTQQRKPMKVYDLVAFELYECRDLVKHGEDPTGERVEVALSVVEGLLLGWIEDPLFRYHAKKSLKRLWLQAVHSEERVIPAVGHIIGAVWPYQFVDAKKWAESL